MSSGHEQWKLNSDDAYKMLVCETHLGASTVDYQSEQYVFKRRNDGTHLINLGKTWEKLLFAARAIAAVENPAEVCIVSARPFAQRAILKFAAHTGAQSIVGRFVPGSFTNQIQKNFKEPRLIVVSDPRVDHQAINEASYVNIPVISFTNTDSPLKYVDIAIPCNNKGAQSIGLMWWMLAREVLRLRGKIIVDKTHFGLGDKIVMPDLYFYRDPEEQKKEELGEEAEEKRDVFADGTVKPEEYTMTSVPGTEPMKPDFKFQRIDDWAAASGVQEGDADNQGAAAAAPAAPTAQPQQTGTDWGNAPQEADW